MATKQGLYANINAKRKRIANGSGETMSKKGDDGAPSQTDFKEATKTALSNTDFDVPTSVRKAAKKGLELRREFKRGGLSIKEASKQGIGSGVTTAKALVKGKIGFELVKRMSGYFSRHASDAKASGDESSGFWGKDENPSAGWIAHLIWGGAAGKRWVESILDGVD